MSQQMLFGLSDGSEVKELKERRKKPEPPPQPSNVREPSADRKAADCALILKTLRECDDVSSLRLRELVPLSLTQRISDLRKDGYQIENRRTEGTSLSLYELKNPQHHGKKYQ